MDILHHQTVDVTIQKNHTKKKQQEREWLRRAMLTDEPRTTYHGFYLVEDVENVVHRWTLLRVVRPATLDETLDPLGYAVSSRPGKPVGKFGAETPAHLQPTVQMTLIRPDMYRYMRNRRIY